MGTTRRSFIVATASAGLVAAPAAVRAQAGFPDKPIKVMVPTVAGGAAEQCLRAVAEPMRQALGQPLVFEYLTGGTGNIALQRAAQSPPDGYTLALPSAANSSNLAARPRQAFDIVGEMRPVGKIGVAAMMLTVSPALNVKTTEELIRYAKANPGKLSYASIGYGSSQHLVAEMFAAAAGIDMVHVPYRGEAAAALDMAGGRIHVAFLAGAKPLVETGKIQALATTNAENWPSMPTVPPLSQTGLPGFVYNGWNGLVAPKATPDPIVARLSAALAGALKEPKVRSDLRMIGFEPGAGTPDELGEQLRSDIANFRKIIAERNLKFPD
ncbi:Bug family tripartite tricarboxylate transporter substrate binding protein [Ramlibacter sp.]|uniref:Bug family tripartite tricarboxylate transporter substrate binding protein n=1 Tax=Ramlibacter sp. TaxID=1917967 RepID=UPI003D10AF87